MMVHSGTVITMLLNHDPIRYVLITLTFIWISFTEAGYRLRSVVGTAYRSKATEQVCH